MISYYTVSIAPGHGHVPHPTPNPPTPPTPNTPRTADAPGNAPELYETFRFTTEEARDAFAALLTDAGYKVTTEDRPLFESLDELMGTEGSVVESIRKFTDPEYQVYLRLKGKFETV